MASMVMAYMITVKKSGVWDKGGPGGRAALVIFKLWATNRHMMGILHRAGITVVQQP